MKSTFFRPHARMTYILFLLTCSLLTTSWTQNAKGYVFEDMNNNSVRDANEKGIRGVGVSNGVDIVQTNADGYYEIPVEDDNIIFVIKPTNYRLPVNEYQQPQSWYIHKPHGSPQMNFTGVKPTGPLPASIDFALISQQEEKDYDILVFGDPQPYTLEEVNHFNNGIVSELVGTNDYQFGISLGDLVGDDLTLFYPYLHSISRIGLPWYHVQGNHDINYDAQTDEMSDETFESVFGPPNYSFNYGNVHYVILDDIYYPDPRDGKGYWGGFRKDQLDFLENDLKLVPKDYLVVVSFHIPIKEGGQFRDADRKRLLDLLSKFPNTLSLSAHTHYQMHSFLGKEMGWKGKDAHHHYNVGTTSGDWYSGEDDIYGTPNSRMRDGTPKGYATLRIKGNQYVFDYKVSGSDWSDKMHIHLPKVMPHKIRNRGQIVVNFYQGSERDSLFFRVNEGDWKKMNHTPMHDPVISKVQHDWDYNYSLPKGKRPSFPVESTHIWRAGLPNDLDPGVHEVEVMAKDFLGRTYTETATYIIR